MNELAGYENIGGHNIFNIFSGAESKNVVILCHGYRSTNTGSRRFFVRLARKLAQENICSLRFDQYCSGNSEGDFINSSFNNWIENIEYFVNKYLKQGYKVSVLGQSMGASASLIAASKNSSLASTVAWIPDPNIEDFVSPKNGLIEEFGQIVKARFWQEAHDAKVAAKLKDIKTPLYILQATDDKYVDEKNRQTIKKKANLEHKIEDLKGWSHGDWSFEQSEILIDKSIDFIKEKFGLVN